MTLSAAILSADDDDVVRVVVAVTVVLWSMLFVVADGGGDVDCGNGDCRFHGGVILPLLVRRRLSFKQPVPNVWDICVAMLDVPRRTPYLESRAAFKFAALRRALEQHIHPG